MGTYLYKVLDKVVDVQIGNEWVKAYVITFHEKPTRIGWMDERAERREARAWAAREAADLKFFKKHPDGIKYVVEGSKSGSVHRGGVVRDWSDHLQMRWCTDGSGDLAGKRLGRAVKVGRGKYRVVPELCWDAAHRTASELTKNEAYNCPSCGWGFYGAEADHKTERRTDILCPTCWTDCTFTNTLKRRAA